MKLLSKAQAEILDLLNEREALSVDEVSHQIGGAKTAIRKHLLAMERRGLLQREYRPAERGRPTLIFRLTSKSNSLFPTKEAEILNELIGYLTREGHEDLLEQFFENYWQKRLELVKERIEEKGRDDMDARVEVLKEVLEDEGFLPDAHINKKGDEVLLRQCHCPIEAITQASGSRAHLPCHLEKRFIAKVLNAPLSSMKLECKADSPCEFQLPISKIKTSIS